MTDQDGYRGWIGRLEGPEAVVGDDVELPAVRSGVDEAVAIFWTTLFTIGCSVCLFIAIAEGSATWAFGALAAWTAAAIAAVGTRWRVRVSTDGVEFRRWVCGVPVTRKTFLLDVEVSLYWTWEDPDDQGIEICDPRGGWGATTGGFGPYFSESAQHELVAWLEAALQEARASVRPRSGGLRCPEIDAHQDKLRVTRWGKNGEVREAVAICSWSHSGVEVPEGATVLFNDDRPIRDPRRDDTLTGVRLSRAIELAGDFRVGRGALVTFVGDRIWVHENGPGSVRRHGVRLYVDDVMFDPDGEPASFMLAKAAEVDGFEIPAESDVSRMRGPARGSYWFHVRLAESVSYEGAIYEQGRVVLFDSARRFFRADSPHLVDATFDQGMQAGVDT